MADNESIERLDVQALQSALSDAGASWQAAPNFLTELPAEERKLYLGFTPPGDLTLEALEERAKAAMAEHQAGIGAVGYPASFDWRNYGGQNYIGEEPGGLRFLRCLRNDGGCGRDISGPASQPEPGRGPVGGFALLLHRRVPGPQLLHRMVAPECADGIPEHRRTGRSLLPLYGRGPGMHPVRRLGEQGGQDRRVSPSHLGCRHEDLVVHSRTHICLLLRLYRLFRVHERRLPPRHGDPRWRPLCVLRRLRRHSGLLDL